MEHRRVTIRLSKEMVEGTVTRMAVYLRCKVLEVEVSDELTCYLVFYMDQVISYKELNDFPKGSFLDRAFQQGIVIHSPHPLISAFLQTKEIITIPKLKGLFNKLQQHITLQEVAYVATTMDHILEKDQIAEIMREIFYHFRRNGQLFHAYQILWILRSFIPRVKWVQEAFNHMQFQKYKTMYEQDSESLIKQDPLFVELHAYHNRDNKNHETKLQMLLKSQLRWIDCIALYLDHLKKYKDFSVYQELLELVQKNMTKGDLTTIQMDLYSEVPSFQLLRKDLLESLMEQQYYYQALWVIQNQEAPLDIEQFETLEIIMENLDPKALVDPTKLSEFLEPLFISDSEKKERIVRRFITHLLSIYEINEVKDWLKPLSQCQSLLPVIGEIDRMAMLSDDPDRQMELGELFYKYGQYKKAVGCFSWEMELNPTNTTPVHWLSKIYGEQGLKKEAKAYQQSYTQLLKYSDRTSNN
ncbi:tetratricopeptide repeat protein [Ammoniphilus resinae]|uniref:Tetratricopeptide (TPR) repeat protein n=1 Tax=Ammoniphilus resinae TaxID=861532 RepID=A0ABS4GL27_9BACL|nr:hypothetical protein [Ammoniphilus resinae]MBP1930951.1 tetratricopeptide (TPR) repeat protein [Ammoniphilus resinae]